MLMRPDSRKCYRAHRCERLRNQIVDVIERVRDEQPEFNRSPRPPSAHIQHFHRHTPRIDKSLQLDTLGATGEAEITADAKIPVGVDGPDPHQMPRPKSKRPLGGTP